MYSEIKEELINDFPKIDRLDFNIVYANCYKKAISDNTHNGHNAKEILKPIIKELITKFYSNRQPKTKIGKLLKNILEFVK